MMNRLGASPCDYLCTPLYCDITRAVLHVITFTITSHAHECTIPEAVYFLMAFILLVCDKFHFCSFPAYPKIFLSITLGNMI